jgi:pimeloyl-ACP methyl ester carboxylesterase
MSEEVFRDLTVEGARYTYRVLTQSHPSTEPVIVIGGALQGMLGWPHMEDLVNPIATLVTADLPGMGSADPLPPGRGMALLCTSIDRIIDDLGVPKVNLFGFSYGAELAYGCAQRRPHRIARLALGGVVNHITAEQRARLQLAAEHLDAGDIDDFVALATQTQLCQDENRHVARRSLVHRYVSRSMRQAATLDPHARRSLHRVLLTKPDYAGSLSGVPTLVFTGEHDTITSPERQRAFAATIPGSRFLTIRDSDHWVVLERARDVADLTARFFTDHPLDTADYITPGARR